MSEPASVCDCIGTTFNYDLKCPKGKVLIHAGDYEKLKRKLEVTQQQLNQYKARDEAGQREENETLNHLRVEQSQHQVRLTLRGKSKMFTPRAIKDLISKLQIMAENAESHEPAAMIHCSHGLNAGMMDFLLKEK